MRVGRRAGAARKIAVLAAGMGLVLQAPAAVTRAGAAQTAAAGRADVAARRAAPAAWAAAGSAEAGTPEAQPGPGSGPRPRLGFFAASRDAEARAEAVFMGVPTPESARRWLRDLTEEPHVAGTEEDRRSAEYVREKLASFGFDTEVVTYEVLLNYPKEVSLRLVEPEPMDLSLREGGYPADKDSYSRDAFPAFHGYGASGTATGQVVYVNYGRREDFEKLEEMGGSARGRIALVRYGRSYRGLKVFEAQEHGAIGVIIYSDPADDGYMKGDVYPQGPMRPETSLQRGSARFPQAGPGDPTTPGVPSRKGAARVPRDKIQGVPRIPSLPLSYGEARKILSALAGERIPDAWQGGLPFAYHLGPGPAKVEMKVEMDYALRPIWDVIATVRGTAEPERWVILGNHRDAWTYGAVDPNSGTASLLEMARGVGEALKAGWKPRRTLMLASWDAEEYGLVGATEWVEDRAQDLAAKAVAYINLDSSTAGANLDVSGVPSLRDLMIEAAGDVPEPKKGGSVLRAWEGRRRSEWAKEEPPCLCDRDVRFELRLGALGSGSDFSPFLDHAGVASVDFNFDGPYGVYHSTFDNLYWMDHFGDPDYLYHTAAARLYGLVAMRLSGAEVAPLRYAAYGRELERLLAEMRRQVLRERREAQAAEKPQKKPPLDPDFSALQEAIAEFARAGEVLDVALGRLEDAGAGPPAGLARLNDTLVAVERAFLHPEGLPGRPWYRHVIYAPGTTTYYQAQTFPGLAQAIDARDAALFDVQSRVLIARLAEASTRLKSAAALASGR